MTETDRIAQAIADAMQALALIEELLTEAGDALYILESANGSSTPTGEATRLPPLVAAGNTVSR